MEDKVYVVMYTGWDRGNHKIGGLDKIFKTKEAAGAFIDQIRSEYRQDESIIITGEHWVKDSFYYITYRDGSVTRTLEFDIREYEVEG